MLGSFELMEEVINSVFGKHELVMSIIFSSVCLWDPFSLHYSICGASDRPTIGQYHFNLRTLGF